MFGSIPAPYVSAPVRAIVTDPLPSHGPLPLTWQRLHDALYCCAPCGESTLAQHIENRGYDASPEAVGKAMQELINVGKIRVNTKMGAFNVPLFVLPGQERVA